jgi:hypothetical protein
MPLVAEREDSTRWYSGITLVEGIADTRRSIESGSWISTNISGALVLLDATLLAIDPLPAMASWLAGAIMEHVKPLSDALDWLAGDPDQIAANARTWTNISQACVHTAADLRAAVTSDVSGWTGAAAEAYRAAADREAIALDGYAEAAAAKSKAVELSGMVVLTVRTLVRDLIADLIATLLLRVPEWTAEVGFSLGIASPLVVAQISTLTAKWSVKITGLLTDLVDSLRRLTGLIRGLDEYTIALNARKGANAARAGGHPSTSGIPKPHSGDPKWHTIELQPKYQGETDKSVAKELFGRGAEGVKYLKPEEREQYRLFVRDGKLYSAKDGKLFDTSNAETLRGGEQAIFVMDSYGNLYAAPEHVRGSFHHSSFLAGQPVSAAGEIKVVNGVVESVSDRSGHYLPPPGFLDQALSQLASEGVDTSSIVKRSW